MMKFFGRRYGAPAYEGMEQAPTPVGEACGWCKEPIGLMDDGWLIPYLGKPGDPPMLPYHRACQLRSILGSVAHQQKRCSCYVKGSTVEDDPTLTPRQAAQAALDYFYGVNRDCES